MAKPTKKVEPRDVLYRIKRGLSAYVSYLAACEMNEAFSEYVLYEPILRVLTARGYTVQCEYECPGIERKGPGDKKRIDFFATKDDVQMAIEVKWAANSKPKLEKDIEKLKAFHAQNKDGFPMLCIFGKESVLSNFEIDESLFKEWGTQRVADLGVTRYGCRFFRLRTQ